jgi:hypothetical protein
MGDENDNQSNDGDDTITNTVSGLKSKTKYYWKVKAEDIEGDSVESEIWSFTTK